ncbi:cyanophycin metabolism-associated DUF1854 family protein [Nitrosovibrio sp. Nv4]|uniref:cyanophycin metabolism-associated DUF1854 family protein n=1 Tax=Nitrosovibrio sp. Nv4 TaxID=1945880 RepID=UPI000BDA6A69|nr:DUF1854 domain-containing protein [Nitrosovibrio sp. Nv4]SOD42642.1 protein of unknown function [Nitrosovibrio sp. Nv4]
MTDKTPYRLSRDAFGRLVYTGPDGETEVGIVPVRAFPITAPDHGLALIDPNGHELVWIDRLDDVPRDMRELVEAELASREFMPEISRIQDVSNYATPSTWYVETNRGKTAFILKGEEYIRRLTPPALLITDSHGIHFLIRDRYALDHHSRRILDRFL